MSAGLEFTIMKYLDRGKSPEELYKEIKESWTINDSEKQLERARKIIKKHTGQAVEQSKFQQALKGDK
jgi:hypothetical protein